MTDSLQTVQHDQPKDRFLVAVSSFALISALALSILGGLQMGHALQLKGVSSCWLLLAPGIGCAALSILGFALYANKVKGQEKSLSPGGPEPANKASKTPENRIPLLYKQLRIKNQAEYIPLSEWIELLDFLKIQSPPTYHAIQEGHLFKTKHLDLSDKSLTALPRALGRLTSLHSLFLMNNQLTSLPSEITNLVMLADLLVSGNRLKCLPDNIGNLNQLVLLDVSENHLTCLPSSIGNLRRLETLLAEKNHLTDIPNEIGQAGSIRRLMLNTNRLTCLPPAIGSLRKLNSLEIEYNPNLSDLPLSLVNCPLTNIHSIGTKIPESVVHQILGIVVPGEIESEKDMLDRKLAFWRQTAMVTEQWPLMPNKDGSYHSCYTWLLRLEDTQDYRLNQEELARTTCSILKTVHEDAAFRTRFFVLIEADLEDCGDRAAMSLNLVYTEWRLHTLSRDATLEEKVQILVSCARTHELRRLVLNRFSQSEQSVHICLFAESKLRKRLQLITATQTAVFPKLTADEIIKYSNKDPNAPAQLLEDLATKIETISTAELIYKLPYWEAFLGREHKDKIEKRIQPIREQRQEILDSFNKNELQFDVYNSQDKDLKKQEEEVPLAVTKEILANTIYQK